MTTTSRLSLTPGRMTTSTGTFKRVAVNTNAQYVERCAKLMVFMMLMNKQHEIFSRKFFPGMNEKPYRLRKHLQRWLEAYTQINKTFFYHFDDDFQEMICDSMDEFEEYTRNDTVRLRIAYRNMLRNVLPPDIFQLYIDCIMCAEFVRVANELYVAANRTCANPITINTDITKLHNSIKHYADELYMFPEGACCEDKVWENVVNEQVNLGKTIGRWTCDPECSFLKKFCKKVDE